MPSIRDVKLSVTTRRPQNEATLIVTCAVEFTEAEVNAMNMLGLRYRLDCTILNQNPLVEDVVLTSSHRELPSVQGDAPRYAMVTLQTVAPMNTLHQQLFIPDGLVAEVRLRNEETGSVDTQRSDVIEVNLAA